MNTQAKTPRIAEARVFDNGGETLDRYTVIVFNYTAYNEDEDGVSFPETDEPVSMYACNAEPFHGIGQYYGAPDFDILPSGCGMAPEDNDTEHLGEEIPSHRWHFLPTEVQKFIRQVSENTI